MDRKVIREIQERVIDNLERAEKGMGIEHLVARVLKGRGLIKVKYNRVPFIDNPSKTVRIPVGWVLTPKGKKFLAIWKQRDNYLD